MPAERYLCLEIGCSAKQRELLTQLLWELDSIGFEELGGEIQPRFLAYFSPQSDPDVVAGQLSSALDGSDEEVSIVSHPISFDGGRWVEEYSRIFTAFEVTPTFWIYPPWGNASEEHPINICLEPGHGFGTGTHESTQLALAAMEEIMPRCHSVADVGTGSGILSVAAAKLHPGDVRIVAFDTDPLAVEAARKTFRLNDLDGLSLYTGTIDSLRDRFDLVVANLTSTLLARLSDELRCRTGRYLIASGFTLDEADRTKEVLEEGGVLCCSEQWTKNGWACWLLRRCEES